MSSDRDYLRHDYTRRNTTALVWLVSTIVAAFVLQLILLSPKLDAGGTAVFRFLALSISGVKDWHLWTLLTHCLLHSTASPWHILFTVLGLVFAGRELEAVIGPRRFLGVFAGAIFIGGLCWTAVHWRFGGMQFGAGSAVFGFLVVLAGIHPHLEMSLLFFPISFRLKHLVYVFLAVNLLGLAFYELWGEIPPLGLSPAADLGGMLAGWLYFRYLHARDGWDRDASFALPAWLRFNFRKRPAPPTPAAGRLRPAATLRADVDRILDKINSHGFGSLSDEEKRTLDEAKDLLSKH
ncbi:MAG TPA: rhomboid family intramembrane serine protease [Lacunisphaera sp.]|nr:rhomboid family intramembrane serine protease [Lacunisphaera sp.]